MSSTNSCELVTETRKPYVTRLAGEKSPRTHSSATPTEFFYHQMRLALKMLPEGVPGRPHKVSTRSSSLAHTAAGSASLPLELHFQQVCNGVLSLKRLRSRVTGSSRNRRGVQSLKQRTPLPHAANFTYIRDTINNHRF